MSGAGAPTITSNGAGLKVTIVAGQWHEEITAGLLAGARRALAEAGAEVTEIRVPGSFELPVASKVALEAGADAVVALGVIIRGGTPHFEYVSAAATDGLTRVALDTGKPVGFGVLTLDDEQQGLDRAGLPGSKEDKGAEAAEAAVATALVLRGSVLKGVDPVLTGGLLKVLDEMGHGDTLVVADRNFPAATTGKPVIRVGEIGAVRAMTAILSVLPLDNYVSSPLERMEAEENPKVTNPTIDAVLALARAEHDESLEYGVIPRFEFYERARNASAVVLTLESAPYCDFILTKGVV